MKRVAIDTNVLISFVTDRNKDQQEQAAHLFELARHARLTIVCHQHVLSEFVYVLERVYGQERTAINAMLSDLLSTPGVEVANDLDHWKLLDIWPLACEEYGDAVLLAYCKERRDLVLATFDQKLAAKTKAVGVKIYH